MSTDQPTPREHQPDELDDEQIDAEFLAIARRESAGDVIQVPAKGDLPAGRIEVVTPEEYAKSEREFRIRQGGPAMVALAYTGRAVGLTARGIGTLLGWTATGAGAVASLGWQYLRAHEYATKLGGADDESSYNKVRKMRRQRWKFLAWCAPLSAAAVNAAGWSALVWGAGMTAADSMWITPSVLTGGLLTAFAIYGRYRKQHRVKAGQVIAPQHMAAIEAAAIEEDVEVEGHQVPKGFQEDVEVEGHQVPKGFQEDVEVEGPQIPKRFQMGMAANDFRRMLHHALTEKIGVTLTELTVDAEKWGYRAHLVLDSCTPASVTEKLNLLEACLPGVRTSSIMPQQSSESRNEMQLRVPGPDPWATLPELPYRAPHSVPSSELHKAPIGADMSTKLLALPMVRSSVNVVGKSRSGKSTVLRSILDALTATSDRIVIGIDLGSAGSGFGEYARAMHAVATTPEQARTVLEWALDIGTQRPGLFRRKGMGQNWVTAPETPGITIVVDEFPALTKKSAVKGRAENAGDKVQMVPWGLTDQLEELFVTSAKSDVTLIIAGQGVTREKIGANTWVTEMPVQVMCACDKDDVGQILHTGAMGEGWLPNRLVPAMPPAINDASVCYVMAGAGYNEPITYRASTASAEETTRRAAERAKAGLVKLDAASARLSMISLDALMADCAEPDWDDEDDDAPRATGHIRGDAVAVMRAREVSRIRPEPLVEALREWSEQLYGDLTADRLRERLKAAGAGAPIPIGDIDGLKNPRGYKLDNLTE